VILGVDDVGAFESGPLEPGVVPVRVRATGFVDWREREMDVRPGSAAHDVTLVRARTIELAVHEESGRGLRIESARAVAEDGLAYRADHSEVPGRRVFGSVPDAALELQVRVGLELYPLHVDEGVLEAELVLPDHGVLHAEVSRATLGPADADIVLRVSSRDGSAQVETERWIVPGAEGPFPLSMDLLPGSYHAELLARVSSEDEELDGAEVRLRPPREVTIGVGETTRIAP
jgi:hypothetical protein